ncbi:restriction endonuclease subunit S [Thalassospira sp. MA62]|nr:restriction endonuclease subunit S [Thalassospira sp. MA62]
MTEQTKLVPKRRFKEFHNTHPWERRKLGEESVIVAGGDINKEKISDVGMYPVFANALTNEGIVGYYKNDYRIEAPAVTVTGRGDVGHAQARKVNFTPVVRLLAIKSEHDVDYLENAINNHKVVVESTGVPQLTSPQLQNYKIYFPSLDEEKKIGKFFNELDAIIAHHQRKSEKFKALKAAYLTEMFPAKGEFVPKRRFSGFTDQWENRVLGQLGQTFTGLSGKTKEDFGHGNAEFVTYMNVFSNPISDTSLTGKIEVDSKQNELKYGDVLFTTSSETPHEVGMTSVWLNDRPNVYLNSFCFGYRLSVDVDYLFLAYLLRSNTVRKQMKLLAQGISRYNISKNKTMEVTVNLPSIQEQEKIGNFFKELDDIITLHQSKLEKLQNLKKAYLHEMFV